jgi:two-component sensor histidine kinase
MKKTLSWTRRTDEERHARGTEPFLGEFARVAALTILPVLLFAAAVAAILGAQERTSVLDALERRASAAAAELDRVFDRQIIQLTTLAGSSGLDEGDMTHFYGEARRALQAQPDWYTIVLSAPTNGQQLVNALRPLGAPLPIAPDLVSHEHVVRTGKPLIIAKPHLRGAVSDRPLIGIRLPVLREGRVIYVLSAGLKSETLQRMLDRLDVPQSWAGAIFDTAGTIMACIRCAEDSVGHPAPGPVIDRIVAGQSGRLFADSRQGIESAIALGRAPLSGWVVGLRVPFAEINALWLREIWIIAVAGLVSVVTALGAIAWLTRRRRAVQNLLHARVRERTADLERAVGERDLLLREVHHRVKNNLQMIASMIRIVARQGAAEPAPMFRDITRRITTLGQAYDRISTADDLRALDLAAYLQSVCDQAMALQAGDAVRLRARLDPIFVDIDTAMPVGLIAGELITNALKHAFPNGRTGEVLVRLERRGDRGVLTVRDNGVGLSPAARAGALGLTLVEGLASRLDGRLRSKCRAEGGAQFRVVFNLVRKKAAAKAADSIDAAAMRHADAGARNSAVPERTDIARH